ncbi:hypothetical protein SK128_021747 [Halocaridina rubra]|uniref:Uncharacterized protein n=1 Tax=Halocaridina rubra TaxID=373956 RepID=A0AAN8XGR5_HALRR
MSGNEMSGYERSSSELSGYHLNNRLQELVVSPNAPEDTMVNPAQSNVTAKMKVPVIPELENAFVNVGGTGPIAIPHVAMVNMESIATRIVHLVFMVMARAIHKLVRVFVLLGGEGLGVIALVIMVSGVLTVPMNAAAEMVLNVILKQETVYAFLAGVVKIVPNPVLQETLAITVCRRVIAAITYLAEETMVFANVCQDGWDLVAHKHVQRDIMVASA